MVEAIVAGEVEASCVCCEVPAQLLRHLQLSAAERICPRSRRAYLDRGDGVFLQSGRVVPGESPSAESSSAVPTAPDAHALLDDRPVRSDVKSRIQLERATFA